jgi:hypothetical protein
VAKNVLLKKLRQAVIMRSIIDTQFKSKSIKNWYFVHR